MALKQNTAEGGSVGVTVTTGNSGAGSGDAFGQITIAGAPTYIFSDTTASHGALSYSVSGASGDTARFYMYNGGGSNATLRCYINLSSLPSVSQQLFALQNSSFSFVAVVAINAANKLIVQDAGGTTLYTATTALSQGVWYRVEMQAVVGATTSTGSLDFQYYTGDSTTAEDSYASGATVNTGTVSIIRGVFGKMTSSATLDAYFDSFGYDDTTASPLGPYSGASNDAPTAYAGTNQMGIEPFKVVTLTGTDSDTDGTVVSRQWQQLSGTSVVLSGATTDTCSFIAPGTLLGDTLTFGYTVTDNQGANSAESTVQCVVLPVTERAVMSGVETPLQTKSIMSGAAESNTIWTVQGGALVRRSATVTILHTTFDSFAVSSPMSITDMRAAMGNWTGGSGATVVNTSILAVAGRGNVVRQHFLAGEFGGTYGIVINAPLQYAVDEATISYDVRFVNTPTAFDWGWGGKLPGLGGVLPDNPGGLQNPPTGGSPSPYGWSGRGMWITPGSYPGSSNSPNEWVGYIYDPTQTAGNYGQNRQTDTSFTAGQWHTVTQYYKMNTINAEGSSGNSDGIHRMWLDGNLVYENTAQVFRIYEAANITHLMWHMFYGGATSDWAPAVDTDIDIDNLLITTP
ncbi:hypothetical protein JNM87_02265 [Candidatus Saccharibacteria bacterium]|nr:hypothetical protein [Candidatus Saccharibacteria bacterium]